MDSHHRDTRHKSKVPSDEPVEGTAIGCHLGPPSASRSSHRPGDLRATSLVRLRPHGHLPCMNSLPWSLPTKDSTNQMPLLDRALSGKVLRSSSHFSAQGQPVQKRTNKSIPFALLPSLGEVQVESITCQLDRIGPLDMTIAHHPYSKDPSPQQPLHFRYRYSSCIRCRRRANIGRSITTAYKHALRPVAPDMFDATRPRKDHPTPVWLTSHSCMPFIEITRRSHEGHFKLFND